MIRRCSCFLLILVLIFQFCSCSKEKSHIINGDIEYTGEAMLHNDTKVILHFSTIHHTADTPKLFRKAFAESQFFCFSSEGVLLNNFLINREIMGNAISKHKNGVSICYADFSLMINNSGYSFLDDTCNLDLPTMTYFAPSYTGRIESKELTYYVLRLGTEVIKGQSNTLIRIVGENYAYDVVIPYSVAFVSYDEVNDRFIYNVFAGANEFKYGSVEFDESMDRYYFMDIADSISMNSVKDICGDISSALLFLANGNTVYHLLPLRLNDRIINDLNLPDTYEPNGKWAVMALQKINLNTNEVTVEYLTNTPMHCDERGEFLLCGVQQMPHTYLNNRLYVFTTDGKLGIYTVGEGFVQYNANFSFEGAIDSYAPLDENDETYGQRSPFLLDPEGNIYVANIFDDGKVRIFKYDFEAQKFNLYWQSSCSVLELVDKDSMNFISIEILG